MRSLHFVVGVTFNEISSKGRGNRAFMKEFLKFLEKNEKIFEKILVTSINISAKICQNVGFLGHAFSRIRT